jgi:hypothetical protein
VSESEIKITISDPSRIGLLEIIFKTWDQRRELKRIAKEYSERGLHHNAGVYRRRISHEHIQDQI